MKRNDIEEFMYELLTNPNNDVTKRLGAAQFFLQRVRRENTLRLITPEELLTACRNVLEEEESGRRDTAIQKFWAAVIEIMDCATDYVPIDSGLPTLDDIEATFQSVVDSLLNNSIDPGALALRHYYPDFAVAATNLLTLVNKLKYYRQYYTGLIPNIDNSSG